MVNTLEGLESTRNLILKENPMRRAAELVARLSADEVTMRAAKYELIKFNRAFQNFMLVLDENIEEILMSNDNSTRIQLKKLPEFPSFSDSFMQEYEKALLNGAEKLKASTSSEKGSIPSVSFSSSISSSSAELSDARCLICLDDVISTEKTIKCNSCRRRFHLDCASQWFKEKSVCPACNRGMLDPTEFPSL